MTTPAVFAAEIRQGRLAAHRGRRGRRRAERHPGRSRPSSAGLLQAAGLQASPRWRSRPAARSVRRPDGSPAPRHARLRGGPAVRRAACRHPARLARAAPGRAAGTARSPWRSCHDRSARQRGGLTGSEAGGPALGPAPGAAARGQPPALGGAGRDRRAARSGCGSRCSGPGTTTARCSCRWCSRPHPPRLSRSPPPARSASRNASAGWRLPLLRLAAVLAPHRGRGRARWPRRAAGAPGGRHPGRAAQRRRADRPRPAVRRRARRRRWPGWPRWPTCWSRCTRCTPSGTARR